MRKRVLLAGLFHETNTFLPEQTPLSEFMCRTGPELWLCEGDGSPLAGALEAGRELDWELLPAIDLRAMPSGTVADEVVELFWTEIAAALRRELARGLDAIFLVLHGAMVSETHADVEGEILGRIRRWEGAEDVPVGGVLDLHANVTGEMALYSNLLVAYRENPHTDAHATAVRAARLLDRVLLSGRTPQTYWAHPPVMWPPTGTGTADAPMSLLEARAREIEAADSHILAVNVLGGFSFADTLEAGVSFTIVTPGSEAGARAYLEELCELAVANRAAGNRIAMPLEEALSRLPVSPERPTILVEPSDNIGAGSPGDTTGLLSALIAHDIGNAGVIINDPVAVAQAASMPPGSPFELAIGGRSGVPGAEPVSLEVALLSTSDGRFRLEDPFSHLASVFGEQIEMGPCAVVRHRGITVLLTSSKTPPFDLGQWRSQGIDPEKFDVICVKAAVGHRQAYEPIAGESFTVETPGPCSNLLRSLPFRRVRRPLYPLDEETT